MLGAHWVVVEFKYRRGRERMCALLSSTYRLTFHRHHVDDGGNWVEINLSPRLVSLSMPVVKQGIPVSKLTGDSTMDF